MASGIQDYYRGVDVALQALSEMIVRPKYGGALLASGVVTAVANGDKQFVGIEGKGMTYGGAVWLDYTLTQAKGIVRLETDLVQLNDISFLRMSDYGITKPRTFPVTLNRYDPTKFIYAVGISYGYTFENSLMLIYSENNGFTPLVHYRLVYTLI